MFLELDFGTSRLLLRHWTCYFEAGPFSFILKKKLCVFLDLEAGMLDLSSSIGLVFWKLSRRNYVCFWTWKLGRWTCHSSIELVFWKLGLRPSFIPNKKLWLTNYVCFWTWKLGRWTCHSSIGLVFWKLGLRPRFILKKKSCLLGQH